MALTKWRSSAMFGRRVSGDGMRAEGGVHQSGFGWGLGGAGTTTGVVNVGDDRWNMDPVLTPFLTGTIAGPTGGTMLCFPIWLDEGYTFSSITFFVGATTGASPSHQVYGLYDPNQFTAVTGGLKLVAQTTDGTGTITAASTPYPLWLSTTASGASGTAALTPGGVYTIPRSGIYYAAYLNAGTTQQTLVGATLHAALCSAYSVTGAALQHLPVKDSVNTSTAADLPNTAQVGSISGTRGGNGSTVKGLVVGLNVGTITGTVPLVRLS